MKQNTLQEDYIEILNKENSTPLDFIDFFLINEENGRCINLCNEEGYTVLHRAVVIGNVTFIDCLINGGAEINAKADDGTTPLHLAVLHNKPAIVEKLIERGGEVFSEANNGEIPLYCAVSNHNSVMVKLLLKYECNDNYIYDYYLNNALERAQLEGVQVIKELIEKEIQKPSKRLKLNHPQTTTQPSISLEQASEDKNANPLQCFEEWDEIIVPVSDFFPNHDANKNCCEIIVISDDEALIPVSGNKRKRGERESFTKCIEQERMFSKSEKKR